MRHHLPAALAAGAILVLVPLTHLAHRHADAYRPRHDLGERVLYLPSGESLGPLTLGFHAAFADLLWIRAVLYFGEHHGERPSEEWYLWLYHMLDLVTDLDPHFTAPYKYGGLMLRISPAWTDASSLLMLKGMEHNPEEWYFPFTISMNYFFDDNLVDAAIYAQRAASLPGAPFYLSNLAATMLNDSDQEEVALRFLTQEFEDAPDQRRKDVIFVKIQETRFEIAARELEYAREAFRVDRGSEPIDVGDLVPRYLPQLPEDPYAVFADDPARCGIFIDPLDRSISSRCLREAKLNIHERYGVGMPH